MNIAFLMEPLSTVKNNKDTTLGLMLGAHRKGHRIFYLPKGGITRNSGQTFFHVTQVIPQVNDEAPFIIQDQKILNESELDVIWIRNNPPFDNTYLTHTWLLDLIDPRIILLNSPSGIRTVNEKIWASQFTSIVPPTLITRNKEQMTQFFAEHSDIIIKPTNDFEGRGVFLCRKGDSNFNVMIELLSKQFSEEIILQRYVNEASQGDKRILLLNGEPLGAVLRLHSEGHHRNNIFAGGSAHAAEITSQDEKIIALLKPYLKKLGLYFVGIDIIGNDLIEINATSPAGLQIMNQIYGTRLEDQVTGFVEELNRTRKLKA